jgi:streptomycin 6-kinase
MGAMLLERLQPGTPLYPLALADDEAATRRAAQVMQQLWQPAPVEHTFATVAEWGEGLQRLLTGSDWGLGPGSSRPLGLVEL